MYKVTKRDCPMFGIGPYVCEFICDTASDITTLPTSISEGTGGKTVYDNQKCASGSIATVAENGAESKQYMLNNQDIWCPYSVASGSSESALEEAKAYTDSEIADLINGAPTTRDTLKEISDAMAENQTVVEALNAAIGTKANKTDIPTKTSELENDSGFLTEHQDLSAYAKTADLSNAVSSINTTLDTKANKTDIPTKTSELENDSGFLTEHQDLSEYAKSADVNTALGNKADVSHVHDGYASKDLYSDTGINFGRQVNTDVGSNSTAEGYNNTASGNMSHAEGFYATASGHYSHAEGYHTTASAVGSHAEGSNTKASEQYSHAEGSNTTASGHNSHAEGSNTTASGHNSHAEGKSSNKIVDVIPDFSSSTSNDNIITAWNSKKFSLAKGTPSHSEGTDTLAIGECSHAEGYRTIASGNHSHAEGYSTTASGPYSHAEGLHTTASRSQSHAEGVSTTASADCSHAEGESTTASGKNSHAEGQSTTASGKNSHAEGDYITASNYASHASGKYSVAMTNGGTSENTTGTAFVIGNGTGMNVLSNAFSVQYDGTVKAKSTITASTTADYAEFFEWLDENPDGEDRVGYFVTLDGDKIRIANPDDDYILGVVSGEPFVLGNGDCDTWNGMFLRDEFRRTIYEPAPKMKEILDDNGKPTGEYVEVEGEYEGTRPKLNPDYDHTKKYISRFDRKEWAPIGMLGVLAVRHDGTAKVNGYVTIVDGGIATACDKNTENSYRVIKANTDSVVEIIFR